MGGAEPNGTGRISAKESIGFFQIAGGIAGDFPICVVPLIRRICGEMPVVGYFCQSSEARRRMAPTRGRATEKITFGEA